MTEQTTITADRCQARHRWRLSLWLLSCCLLFTPVDASDPQIHDTRTLLVDGVYRVGARVDLNLNDTLQEALHNGVPLVLKLSIEVIREREWLFPERVAQLEQKYELEYHALTKTYLVRVLSTGAQHSFRTLDDALTFIGNIYDLPLIDANLLRPGRKYWVRMRTDLDVEALPTPIRVWAYLGSEWSLQGDWHRWPLLP
ncbi:uncharacterized protein DUF4390 [Thiogranum longum]|uniref:Uncharacterized protein DUF4390 n=1 Tax=Thiogranum longum TaxID=1537524 RepID=A0A4R1H9K0_9GAMM|nr:DUF4390 domain-containing protein [Thiogranum longum]TCK16790.1 uncharacterized protein DUF4390 [Thiogranum longum]